MKIKLQSTNEVRADGVKVVLYGAAGSGKTVLCATAPNPIIISAEKGLLSLAHKDIPFIQVDSVETIGEAYTYVKTSDYDTICIDSLSEISEIALSEFKLGVADGRQAYMQLAERLGALIRNFRDMKGKHVVFTAKMKRVDDEETGTFTYEPYMPGKVLPFQVPYLVDELFCLRVDRKGTRKLQTNSDRRYVCKDRSGVLSSAEDPDLTSIFNKITGANQQSGNDNTVTLKQSNSTKR